MTKRVSSNLLLLLGVAVLLVCVLYGAYLFGDRLFIFPRVGSDTYYQYWPYDRYCGEMLHSGELSNWSFRATLGKQIFLWRTFANPFVLFVQAVPQRLQASAYAFKMVFECLAAVLLWFLYLRKIGIKGKAAVIFPLLYGFNGYLILWGQHTGFGILFSVIPLTLYAYEHLIRDGRYWPLAASLTLFLSSSYYLFFMFSIFFAFFAAYRFMSSPEGTWRGLLSMYVKLGVCYVLAVLLSAWLLLPTIAYLSMSPRIAGGSGVGPLSLYPMSYYVSLLRVFSNNIFGVGINYRGPVNYYEALQLACGLLVLLLIPQYFVLAPKRERWWGGALLLLLLLSLLSPYLSHIFNGFSALKQRHSFALIVLCIFLAARVFHWLETGKGLNRRVLIVTLVVLGGGVLIALGGGWAVRTGMLELPAGISEFGFSVMREALPNATAADFDLVLKQEFLPAFTGELLKAVVLLAAYGVALFLLRNRPKLAMSVLIVVVFGELTVMHYPTLNERVSLPKSYVHGRDGYFDPTMQALDVLRKRDDSFWRMDKTFNSVFLNDAAFQGYYGTKGYLSVQEPSTLEFLSAMAVPPYLPGRPKFLGGFGDRDRLNSLCAVKYVLSKKRLRREGYEAIGLIHNFLINENKRALPLGFVYHKMMDPEWFGRLLPHERDWVLLQAFVPGKTLWADQELLKAHTDGIYLPDPNHLAADGSERAFSKAVRTLREESFEILSFEEDRIKGRVVLTRPGVLFLSIPYSAGWRAIVDGSPVQVHRVNVGFIGLPLGEGNHAVELKFTPTGSILGGSISVGALVGCLALVAFRGRRRDAAGLKKVE